MHAQHVVCIFNGDICHADVINRVEEALGGCLDELPVVHKVRLVAPDKHHVCISFRMPRSIAFNDANGPRKRTKLEQE